MAADPARSGAASAVDESDRVRGMLEEGRRRFLATGGTYGQMHADRFIANVAEQSVEQHVNTVMAHPP